METMCLYVFYSGTYKHMHSEFTCSTLASFQYFSSSPYTVTYMYVSIHFNHTPSFSLTHTVNHVLVKVQILLTLELHTHLVVRGVYIIMGASLDAVKFPGNLD